jgi:glycyl-tRNA synthetase alpha subunit
MEVSQFTYFQQVGGHDCRPVSGELTYGLERLAMYVLGVSHVMEMPFNDPSAPIPLTYGDVFRQTEEEYSRHNFDAPTPTACSAISRTPSANVAASSRPRTWTPSRASASSWPSGL